MPPRVPALKPLSGLIGTYLLGVVAGFLVTRRKPPPPPRRRRARIPRPLEGSYAATLATAIIALSPFIVVTTAYVLFSPQVQSDLHVGQRASEIIAGISTAGYAWGALVGGDLVQRFRQRGLFLICEAVFVAGCAGSALAHNMVAYGAGRVLAGLGTGLLLVVALPPVIQRFPPSKVPISVAFINIGFFGAVCIGPLLGGWVAAGHHWRWFYGALGIIGAVNLLAALFTLPDQAPPNPGCVSTAGLSLSAFWQPSCPSGDRGSWRRMASLRTGSPCLSASALPLSRR